MLTDPAFAEAEKAVKEKTNKLFSIKGKKTVDELHKQLGLVMWDYVGMARNEAGLKKALELIKDLKKEFWSNVYVAGENGEFNQELEKALRLADFLEMGELMAMDALNRKESCGGHVRRCRPRTVKQNVTTRTACTYPLGSTKARV